MNRWYEDARFVRLGTIGALAALVIFHTVNNWYWLAANVTVLGWDVPSHLGTSFIYNDILRPLNLKTLFSAIVWHPNRPPLYFLSAVPLYRWLGVSSDIGVMVNVLYLAILVGSVYGIGQRLGGRRVGLLAAFVVAAMPMIYAISRYFYQELALTAMVALSVYLLLASERFTSRTASLLFGLSFGLGLLTKRTYLAFIIAPLCLVVARSSVFSSLRKRLVDGFRVRAKDVLVALGLGLALALVWYLPAREIANQLFLGPWLVPLWTLLAAMTIYFLRLEPGPDSNLLTALFLGGALGSLWYLPRITFLQRLLSFGFGVNDPRERSANLGELSTYFYFLNRLVTEHLSPIVFALLLVAVLGLLLALGRKGDIWATLRRANDAWWVTVLWVVAAYLLFTFSIYRKSRGITPVLPAVALILAVGLFQLPWKRVVAVLVVLVVVWGLLQFFVLSYEGPHRLTEHTAFTLPVLGDIGAFAQGGTLQLPASGETDPGYWVVPEILDAVEVERQAVGAEALSLGMIVNNEHVNPDLMGMVALQGYPGIQIQNLARSGSSDSVYARLFEQDYVVLIDGDYHLIDAAAESALQHLDEAPGLFEAAFELAQTFSLPNDDTVLLYRKAWQPEAGTELDDYRGVAQTIDDLSRAGDAIVLVPPQQIGALGQTYQGRLRPYLLPQEQPLTPEAAGRTLEEIAAQHPMLFVIFRSEEVADPDRFIEGWLNEHAYRGPSEWHGSVRLVVFGAPLASAQAMPAGHEAIEHTVGTRLGDQIRILDYHLAEESVRPRRMVRVVLFWETAEPVADQLVAFIHVVDGEGRLVAQQDGEPVGGSRPTTTWAPGEVVLDRRGVLLPHDLDDGEYQLVVGLYDPDTGERLPVLDAEGYPVGDSIPLGTIKVGR